MKTGKSLTEIAAVLDQQRAAKRDFVVDTRKIEVVHRPAGIHAVLAGNERFGMRPNALRQLEEHVGVPAKFADRLLEAHPDLLAYNLNELLHRAPSEQLVRTLGPDLRAFLSSSYRCIDNYEFAEAVLTTTQKFPHVRVESCEVTESRLYIKIVRDDLIERVGFKEGWQMGEGHNLYDEVRCAAVFSNSEVGAGALWFRPAAWTKNCTNLAVWEQASLSKVHLGRKNSAGDDGLWEILSDKTKGLSDAALWSQITDLTAATLEGKFFREQVEALRGATTKKIEGDVPKCVELVAKQFSLNETERKGVLHHLIQGGALTQYGLHSAVTRMSQDVEDYDRASELERLGGRIIELKPSDWKTLAEAA